MTFKSGSRSRVAFAGLLGIAGTLCWHLALAQNQPDLPKRQSVLILRMSVVQGLHSVLEARVEKSSVPLRLAPDTGQADTLDVTVTDVDGKLLMETGIPDPRVIHSPLAPPGQPPRGHQVVRLDSAEYVIQLPYIPAMRFLKLTECVRGRQMAQGQTQGRKSALTASGTTTTIDLAAALYPGSSD